MRMVQVAREKGTDQVREVIQHGRRNGVTVFPSLRLQDAQAPGPDRCGWLRWRHEAAVCHGVNDPRWPKHQTQWAYDFTNHLVWDDKKAMIRELLVDYEADGIELDFMFFPLYFRMEETEAGISAMNRFVEESVTWWTPSVHSRDARFRSWPASTPTSRQTSTSASMWPRG